MNILFIKHFVVGFMVSEVPRVSVFGYKYTFPYIGRVNQTKYQCITLSQCACITQRYGYDSVVHGYFVTMNIIYKYILFLI